ncbi:MAG TPA: heat-inducible transcription repressor HrcA [Actinobacteria bacterium]|nr:heat-inducible transcription repressor HrcA [Actinomycetota bacterium]
MPVLDARKDFILNAVVEDYIKNAEPVGSQRIIDDYGLKVSSATVRNELSLLEKTEYLSQPHTSAGRVPTDKGYRYYVDALFEKKESLVFFEEKFINQIFSTLSKELETFVREVSAVLSKLTNYTAFVCVPHPKGNYLKHLDLVLIRPQAVLMVLITSIGYISKKVISFDYKISQASLRNLEILLNEKFVNLEATKIMEFSQNLIEFPSDIRDMAGKTMTQIINCLGGKEHKIFLEGVSNILQQSEFRDSEKVRMILEILEQGDIIANLSDDATEPGFASVKIGHENDREEVNECSIVFASYGTKEKSLGTLGVLGPTRLDYLRTIRTVGGVANNLGCFLETLYE